jgi:hypothetical protein
MKPVQDNPSRFADRREFAAIRVYSRLKFLFRVLRASAGAAG